MNEYSKYLVAIAALIFVLSLIGILSFLVKKYGSNFLKIPKSNGSIKRLKVVEILQIDAQRKLILFERDNIEHLILLSNNGNVLIERNIKKTEPNNLR